MNLANPPSNLLKQRMMNIESYLADRKELVEKTLTQTLQDPSIPETLKQPMEYSLKAGGKRLRPILVMAGAEAVGSSAKEVIKVACAIEMIHTFSLIHDDLPAMDNDDLRRGKPTNHKVFGEASAILAGDALLAEAFLLLADKERARDTKIVLDVLHDIAWATGARGMTGGQQIDMDSQGKKISEQELSKLHRMKTGRLIVVSATSGARYGGATPSELKALHRYGECIGLAFQIADDLLDIEGDQEEIGKDVGSDIGKDKATFPSVIGHEASRQRASSLVNEAISSLSSFDKCADPLREIAKFVVERRK